VEGDAEDQKLRSSVLANKIGDGRWKAQDQGDNDLQVGSGENQVWKGLSKWALSDEAEVMMDNLRMSMSND